MDSRRQRREGVPGKSDSSSGSQAKDQDVDHVRAIALIAMSSVIPAFQFLKQFLSVLDALDGDFGLGRNRNKHARFLSLSSAARKFL
jgi:hypothetical protein